MFWNYIKSKTTLHSSTGDLIHINNQGVEEKVCTVPKKAKIFKDHFSNVFNKNMSMDSLPNQDKSEVDMNRIIIDTDDIKKRLNKLNVFKSSGAEMLHPRLLKEV